MHIFLVVSQLCKSKTLLYEEYSELNLKSCANDRVPVIKPEISQLLQNASLYSHNIQYWFQDF